MNVGNSKQETPLILVVDDDRMMRLHLCQAMEQAGYRVAEASDGEQALAAYTSLHPDIVLLDLVMPKMDGFTCCARLQQLSSGDSLQDSCALLRSPCYASRTPILVLTALEDRESVDLAFEAGASDYITKPIHWAVLCQRVRRLLETSQAIKELQQHTERQRLVTNIAQRIRSSLKLEEILSITVSEVRQFLQVERVIIYRFLSDWSGIVAVESVDSSWSELVGMKIADSFFRETANRELYQQGRMQATADIYTAGLSPCHIDLLEKLQVRANLVVPIVQGQHLWGLLVANQCSRSRQWQQLEIDLLQQLAAQLAIAIQQSQLYEQTQLQVHREQALNRVIQTIRNSLDLTTIFSTAVFEIANLLQADRAHIVQYLPAQKLWLNVADHHQNLDLPSALGLKIPDIGNEIAAALKRLEVVRIDDASTCADEINRSLARAFPGAWLLVPLHFGSSVWGSLGLVRDRQHSVWQEWEVELTSVVADQLAIAIQQSTLLEQVQTELTQRQQAEVALRESEARFRTMADTAPVMIWVAGTDKLCNYFNQNWLEFTGRTLEQEIGNGWTEGIHPDDRKRCLDTYFAAFETRQLFTMEFRLRRFDGEDRWILDTGTPRYNTDGSFAGYIGSCIDITERQLSEQKIREQAALLDVATDAILVRDLENRILFWNKSAERLYGWKVEDALGKNANELLDRKNSLQLEEALRSVILEGEWHGELHQVTKDGKEIVVETRWTLVRDASGKPKSILTVDTDITQKKQLEAQFLRVQRLESLGTLAGGIAHDLNNVLAPMLMTAQLLQMKSQNERERQLLGTLETNVKRGAALVKQVLSFARGVEGERTIVQPRQLILEIGQIVNETFPKSIQFYTDIVSDLWTIAGDATQLHQVLMNLVVNARDAMPNGGTLRISAENFSIDEHYARMHLEATVGPYIVLTVADTGTGIPSEIMERIFEPFFTTKEIAQGTGLGLSTTIGIVKSHGGFVSVVSEVGKGSQFKVYLPAVYNAQATQTKEKLRLPQGQGELILVVDDEAVIRDITKTSLEAYNYRVLTASDGIEAIALYAKQKNDVSLVVVDMMMPNMDGATTIRTLQKMNPHLKIIATSGLMSNERVALAASVNVKAFLAKPYAIEKLLHAIHSVLNT